MLNHDRTLLLNLDYVANSEHIPSEFKAMQLPKELQAIYDILFPQGSSRYYKLFLAQNYLSVIFAAGLSADLEKFDKRISYSVLDNEYFKINRVSNPDISDFNFPIFISGSYNNVARNKYYFDHFEIQQVGNTNRVTVYSPVNNLYHSETESFTMYDPARAEIMLEGVVRISNTGISFAIAGLDITSTERKRWSFIVEAPYTFDFTTVYNNLVTSDKVDGLFQFKPEIAVTNYDNLWTMHYNPVYKLAGLLLAYIEKVNSII